MNYTQIGNICVQEIEQTTIMRSSVNIHDYVVMPNHVHLLMVVSAIDGNLSNNTTIGHPAGMSLQQTKHLQQTGQQTKKIMGQSL